MENWNLCVKDNNVEANDPCAICGQRTDPVSGPELFLDGTSELVCHDCGDRLQPSLVGLLRLANAAHGFEEACHTAPRD